MSKQFTVGPLGEHDDHWLTIWAALTGKGKAQLATSLIGLRVRERKTILRDMLTHSAVVRGMTPEALFCAILEDPNYLEQNPAAEVQSIDIV